jgi:hypothetical protein
MGSTGGEAVTTNACAGLTVPREWNLSDARDVRFRVFQALDGSRPFAYVYSDQIAVAQKATLKCFKGANKA